MIPTLYDKTGNNKIGDLNDCIECLVEEERNGIFELTMVYPANSSILESIVYDNIIVADANDYLKSQKFRIYNTRKLMANRIEVCARHISFDLVHDWVDVISIENQSCEYALNTIFRNSQFSKHFKGHSDIVNAQNFKVNKVTCLEAIGGTDGSIIDTYGTGAEILRDNTDIHVLNRRGHDNDVTIEYRKNLTGLEVEEDTTDLVTRIMPYAIYTNSNNEEVEVRGDFIDSPLINNYAHPYVKYMDYSEEFEDGVVPTKTKLNNLATKEYTINKVDIPKCNYKIEFIPLSKCAGYEGLEDRINLCDVVTVKDSRYNIDTQAKVIKVVFDVLRGRYDSMELGEPRTTLGDIIGGTGDGPIQGPPGPPGPQGPAGADGSIGDFPETLPEVPNITAKVYGFANIEISWTFENKVYYSYELYASKTKGFVPNTFNLIFSGQASTYLYQAEPNETWYFRACALNTHGQRTEFSEEVQVSTVKISDLSNYVESAAIGDALIGELNLGRGWYGELRGNYIDAKQMSVTDGNGKRTLDIDTFGNVNLDVTSLKIRANSVATESFVTTAKNDAITSANNTLNTTIANYYTKTETDSQINVAKDSINLGVSQTYETKANVQAQINSIQVGSRNLVQNSSFNSTNGWVVSNGWSINKTETFRGNNSMYINRSGLTADSWSELCSNKIDVKRGEEIVGSWYIKYRDCDMTSVVCLWGYKADGSGRVDLTSGLDLYGTNENWTRYVLKGTVPANVDYVQLAITHKRNGIIYAAMPQLEYGNTVSDWSPSPIDVNNDITQAKNDAITSANGTLTTTIKNYYTKTETDSQINVAKDSINLGVSQTYETKANVETKVNTTLNSAKSYADTKKSEAISSANNALNTTIANYYTKSETDSKIAIAKDAINLGVSNTYETKANVETKINGVAIGGTNLLLDSHFDYDRNWAKGTGVTRVREGFDGGYCMKTVGALKGTRNFSQEISITKLEKGQQYTATVWLKTQDVVRGTTNPHLYLFASYYLNNKWVTECALSKAIPNGTTAWTKYVLTFTMPTVDFDVMTVEGYARDFTGTIWWDGIKLEKGNKASDWSPSPLDISTDITNAKTDAINTASTDATNKVNSAKTELNTAIGKKANSADVYTKTQVYTKEQTDSAIKIAKDEIKLGVSNTYETKTNVETKINTAVNNVQVGGRNLWRFTKEYDGTKYSGWVDNNDAVAQAVAPYTTVNGFGVQRIAGTWNDISQRATIEANTDYTLSAWIKWESTAGSMMFYTNTGTMSGTDVTSQVGTTDYKRVSITFNSGNATVSTCRFECNSNTPYLIYGLKLEKGTKATDWTPAPEDIENEMTILESETKTLKESVSSLQLNSDSISASVKSLQETVTNTTNGLSEDIQSVQNQVDLMMTSDQVKLEIQKEMSKGANKVSTSTGFTFNDNGLNISKSDSEMSTQITEDGMKVYRNNDIVLTANNQGVDAKNLHATTYLIIGGNSRMEDVVENNVKRTAVFWIGN